MEIIKINSCWKFKWKEFSNRRSFLSTQWYYCFSTPVFVSNLNVTPPAPPSLIINTWPPPRNFFCHFGVKFWAVFQRLRRQRLFGDFDDQKNWVFIFNAFYWQSSNNFLNKSTTYRFRVFIDGLPLRAILCCMWSHPPLKMCMWPTGKMETRNRVVNHWMIQNSLSNSLLW